MPSTKPKPRREKKTKAGASASLAAATATSARRRSKRSTSRTSTTLRRMMSDKGKIRSRRITGTCRRHQNQVAVAVKRAREMALLPYVNR